MDPIFREFDYFCDDVVLMLNQLTGTDTNQAFFCYLPQNILNPSHAPSFRISDYFVVSASQELRQYVGKNIIDILNANEMANFEFTLKAKFNMYFGDSVYVYFDGKNGLASILCIKMPNNVAVIEHFELMMECFGFYISNCELHHELDVSQRDFIFMLGEAAEVRSKETGSHIHRVSEYVKLLCQESGMTRDEINLIYLASMLHDLGKLGIEDKILNKPDKLSTEEFEQMKLHCQIGYEMLKTFPQPVMKMAAKIALEHHERYDGSGYPQKLKGEEISLPARMVAIADVFDALGTDRVYKQAWNQEKIVKHFSEEQGRLFDPVLVSVLLKNMDQILCIKQQKSFRYIASNW